MNIYCAFPIRGDTRNKDFRLQLVGILNEAGHTPLCETAPDAAGGQNDYEIFNRDIGWIEQSSCVIADVTAASTGVGFEIAYALYYKKIPVLALYKKDSPSVSAMIKGCHSELLETGEYNSLPELSDNVFSFIRRVGTKIE